MSDKLKKYNVTDVKTVKQFCDKYYRYDRYKSRGKEYIKDCQRYHQKEFETNGFTMLSSKDSNTGNIVTFFKN